jgi:O-antigen/teichoic acid export membrane protein
MKAQLARGVAWIAATRATVSLIGVVSTVVLARLLLPQDFGLVAVATTVMAIVSSVTDISLSSALTQHSEPGEAHYNTAFTLNSIRSLGVTLVTGALAWPIAQIYNDPRLFNLIVVLAMISGTIGLTNPKMVIFWRALVFWQEFAIGVSQKALGFVAALVVALIYQSYWALVVGAVVSQVVSVLLSYVLIPYRPRFDLSKSGELVSFSIWLTMCQMISTLSYRFDNLLVGYLFGPKLVGFYSYADNMATIVTREVSSPAANTFFPAYARLKDETNRLRAAHARTQSLLFAVALPIGCGFAMVARPLVHLALGDKWLPAIFIMQVIATVSAVQTLGTTEYPLALALGQTSQLFHLELKKFIVRLPILAIGLVAGGFVGVVMARAVAGGIMLWLNLCMIQQLIGRSVYEQVTSNARPLVAVSAMAAVLATWQAVVPSSPFWRWEVADLVAQMGLGSITYCLATYLSWIILGRPQGVEQETLAILSALRRPSH